MATSPRRIRQIQDGPHRSAARNAMRAAIKAGVATKVQGQPNTYKFGGRGWQAYADAIGGLRDRAGNYTSAPTFAYATNEQFYK